MRKLWMHKYEYSNQWSFFTHKLYPPQWEKEVPNLYGNLEWINGGDQSRQMAKDWLSWVQNRSFHMKSELFSFRVNEVVNMFYFLLWLKLTLSFYFWTQKKIWGIFENLIKYYLIFDDFLN